MECFPNPKPNPIHANLFSGNHCLQLVEASSWSSFMVFQSTDSWNWLVLTEIFKTDSKCFLLRVGKMDRRELKSEQLLCTVMNMKICK